MLSWLFPIRYIASDNYWVSITIVILITQCAARGDPKQASVCQNSQQIRYQSGDNTCFKSCLRKVRMSRLLHTPAALRCYMNLNWPKSMSSYGVTLPHWVKSRSQYMAHFVSWQLPCLSRCHGNCIHKNALMLSRIHDNGVRRHERSQVTVIWGCRLIVHGMQSRCKGPMDITTHYRLKVVTTNWTLSSPICHWRLRIYVIWFGCFQS